MGPRHGSATIPERLEHEIDNPPRSKNPPGAGADDGFEPWDWEAPLDTTQRLAQVPSEATIKGMFITQALDRIDPAIADRITGGARFSAFREYPIVDWIPMCEQLAAAAFPDLPPRRGIARFALDTFEHFRDSLIGRVIFTVTGFRASLSMVPRAYRRASVLARVELQTVEQRRAVLAMTGVWDFPSWHIGTFLGGMRVFDLEPTFRVRWHSVSAFDVEMTW